jgi:hypothetical protein
MPQPRRTSSGRSQPSRSSGGAKRSTARSGGGAKRSTARSSGGVAKRASGGGAKRSSSGGAKRGATSQRKAASSARKPAARKAASQRKTTARKSTARKTTARKSTSQRKAPARSAAASSRASGLEPQLRRGLTAVREMLSRGVVLSGERLQETMDDAVQRGRVTRSDAEDLVQRLLDLGRRQTEDVLSDLEQLLGRGARGGDVVASARQVGERARARVGSAAKQARSGPGDRVLREVDRARRAAGIGQTFPILGYEDLSAAQVSSRLGDLTPAELRKVRDHERRHANRKSVLDSIETKLR